MLHPKSDGDDDFFVFQTMGEAMLLAAEVMPLQGEISDCIK
jgi:hypothetical protein